MGKVEIISDNLPDHIPDMAGVRACDVCKGIISGVYKCRVVVEPKGAYVWIICNCGVSIRLDRHPISGEAGIGAIEIKPEGVNES